MSNKKIVVYTDGGSRGNPGPAALGVAFVDERGQVTKAYGEPLGVRTNNEAEYEAIIFAFKKAKQLFGKDKTKTMHIEVRMDSELACRQLCHEYKVENENIIPLFLKVWNLMIDFGEVTFTHVPREKNKDADRMVNEALDSGVQKSLL
ncbi:MAG: ribonuclease HI family protein [Patescibacteria group bacterium]